MAVRVNVKPSLERCTLLPCFTCDPLCLAFDLPLQAAVTHVCPLFFPLATEEKKSLKRTFQQIQEEEDDDYPGSYSPQDPSAGPLLVRPDPPEHWAEWLEVTPS